MVAFRFLFAILMLPVAVPLFGRLLGLWRRLLVSGVAEVSGGRTMSADGHYVAFNSRVSNFYDRFVTTFGVEDLPPSSYSPTRKG